VHGYVRLKYPTFEAIVEFNKTECKRTGEEHVLEDRVRLRRILRDVKGVGKGIPLEEAIIKKAAYLLFSITSTQPFHEGNKRTAYVTAKAFLKFNGFEMEAPKAELFDILEGIIFTRVTLNRVEEWLMGRVIRR